MKKWSKKYQYFIFVCSLGAITFFLYILNSDYFYRLDLEKPTLIKETHKNTKEEYKVKNPASINNSKDFKAEEKESSREILIKGKRVFDTNCISCHHTLRKDDVNTSRSQVSIEALADKKWDEFLKIVKYGIPRTAMQGNFHLKEEEIQSIFLWLKYVKAELQKDKKKN